MNLISRAPRLLLLMPLLLLLLVLLPCAAGPARADQVLVLRDGQQSYRVNRFLGLLNDPGARMTLSDVRAAPAFAYPDSDTTKFGFSEAAYWARVEIANDHPTLTQWFLVFQYPVIDRAELFVVHADGRQETAVSGDTLPFSSRAVKHRHPMFKIVLAKGERASVYLRVRSAGAIAIPLVLRSAADVMAHDHDQQYMLGIYYGILLALFIYNSMLFLWVRERNYLYYALYVGSWTLMQMALNGLAFEYLWPASPRWANMAVPFFLGIVICSAAQFAASFLEVKRYFPRLDALLKAYQVLGVLVAAGALLLPYSPVIQCALAIGLSECLLVFLVGSVCLVKGVGRARYFMLAWSTLLIGTVLYVMQNASLIPTVFITEYGLQIGSAMEVLLFSFALAHRMKRLQEGHVRIQREATLQLEQRVLQRTAELDGALSDLADAHQRLKELSRIDSLTGIKNRAHFDERIGLEWQRGMRERQVLGVLMIDIDHFKGINDTYGHLSGDACLKAVADALARQLHRIGDDAFRFGGEEFIVLLPNTELAGAAHMGELLRVAVQALDIVQGGHRIALTISVGVACMTPLPGTDVAALIERADKALYQAKLAGRNRVCGGDLFEAAAPLG
jgi:diguanylate cyclase (GGDEF)-like protein